METSVWMRDAKKMISLNPWTAMGQMTNDSLDSGHEIENILCSILLESSHSNSKCHFKWNNFTLRLKMLSEFLKRKCLM